MNDKLVKLGTIDSDLPETTPVVFKDRLFRFEYVNTHYKNNATGRSYFQFVDVETGKKSSPFAFDCHLGNVMIHEDMIYVTANNNWGGTRIDIYVSSDMENWQSWNALDLPDYRIYNTSMCRGDDKFVMMFEIDRPVDLAGVPFTARFAVSKDMKSWKLTPDDCTYAKNRYTAPHCLRYHKGYYYNFYLEAVKEGYEEHIEGGYEQCVVRSKDLVNWESSPLNPVLMPSDEDRVIANADLTPEQREVISTAEDCNNSDIDMCEFNGQVIINYAWGNQRGIELLAEARFDGTMAEFLQSWFPES